MNPEGRIPYATDFTFFPKVDAKRLLQDSSARYLAAQFPAEPDAALIFTFELILLNQEQKAYEALTFAQDVYHMDLLGEFEKSIHPSAYMIYKDGRTSRDELVRLLNDTSIMYFKVYRNIPLEEPIYEEKEEAIRHHVDRIMKNLEVFHLSQNAKSN